MKKILLIIVAVAGCVVANAQDFDLAVFATISIIKYYIVKNMPIRAMLTLLVSQTATVEY